MDPFRSPIDFSALCEFHSDLWLSWASYIDCVRGLSPSVVSAAALVLSRHVLGLRQLDLPMAVGAQKLIAALWVSWEKSQRASWDGGVFLTHTMRCVSFRGKALFVTNICFEGPELQDTETFAVLKKALQNRQHFHTGEKRWCLLLTMAGFHYKSRCCGFQARVFAVI